MRRLLDRTGVADPFRPSPSPSPPWCRRIAAHPLLAGSLLLCGLLLTPESSHGGDKLRLALGPTGFTLAPVYLAVALGAFERHGIEVERIVVPREGLEIKALEAGQVDLAFTGGDSLLSVPAGRPLSIIYSGFQRAIVNWALRTETARQRGIGGASPLAQRLRVLRGLTVGVTAPGSLSEHLARYQATRDGLVPERDLRLVSVGRGPGWSAALKDGRVDAALHAVPFPEMAAARGEAIVLVDNARGEDGELAEFLMGVLVARAERSGSQGGPLRRAVLAFTQSVRWALANPPSAAADALQPFLALRYPREALEGVKAVLPALNPTGRVTEGAFRTTAGVLETVGALKRRVRFEEIVSGEFLPG